MVDDAMEMAPGRTYVRFICLPAYLVLPELFNLFDNILVKYQSVTYVSHLMQPKTKSAPLLFYGLNPMNPMIKNFSFLLSKSPIRFCPENSIQTDRRAKRGGFLWLAISEMVRREGFEPP